MRSLVAFLLLISSWSFADGVIVDSLNLKTLETKFDWGVIPFVKHEIDSISDKINASIQQKLFFLEKGESMGSHIKQNEIEDAWGPNQTFHEFQVLRNDTEFLVIVSEVEGYGAYCEDYSIYLNVDVVTGDLVELSDLYTKSGLIFLDSILMNRKQDEIKKNLLELDSKKSNWSKANLNELECVRSVLTDCYTGSVIANVNFAYLKDSIVFQLGRCSNHAMLACDPIGDFYFKFPVLLFQNELKEERLKSK